MRAVLDTNVIVSGLISSQGDPRRILDLWAAERFTLVYSQETFAELHDVLNRTWLQQRMIHVPRRIPELMATILEKGELIRVEDSPNSIQHVEGLRDPLDEKFLICASIGQVRRLVTGDKDLLVLGSVGNIRIVTATDFLAEIEAI